MSSGMNYGKHQPHRATNEVVVGAATKMPAQPSKTLLAKPLRQMPMVNVKGDLPAEIAEAQRG